jgi:hypothetical protein
MLRTKFPEAAFDAANIKNLLTGFRGNFSVHRRLTDCTTRIPKRVSESFLDFVSIFVRAS